MPISKSLKGTPIKEDIKFLIQRKVSKRIINDIVDNKSEELKKLLYSDLSIREYSIIIELGKPSSAKGMINKTKIPYSDKIPFCSGEIALVKKGIMANIIPLFIKEAIV